MARAELLQRLGAAPGGLIVHVLTDDVLEARDAGFVRVRLSWDVDVVTLTDDGRRVLGLPWGPARPPSLKGLIAFAVTVAILGAALSFAGKRIPAFDRGLSQIGSYDQDLPAR